MRAALVAVLALAVLPPALAHEGPHGLDFLALRADLWPSGGGVHVEAVVVNDDTGPARNGYAYVSLHGTLVSSRHTMPEIASGATVALSFDVPLKPSPRVCVQVVAGHKASDLECVVVDGVRP